MECHEVDQKGGEPILPDFVSGQKKGHKTSKGVATINGKKRSLKAEGKSQLKEVKGEKARQNFVGKEKRTKKKKLLLKGERSPLAHLCCRHGGASKGRKKQ